MSTYFGPQQADDPAGPQRCGEAPDDFRALFLGEPGESEEQRAVREQAAHDVLADLLEAGRHGPVDWLDALYAAHLLCIADLRKRAIGGELRAGGVGEAA
ncbi:hypothetical protein ACFVIM_13785 [Streptomyces sp. NPDC057638]|uniref:hypothetical protein n=1 Tax=Streptomyces sp. NPDC057638 TaxID=3346190 RepID=UPI0036C1CE54